MAAGPVHAGIIEAGHLRFSVIGDNLLFRESRQRQPYEHLKSKIQANGKDTKPTDIEIARQWMCENFFDVRAFGAVMTTTQFNCGQVRRPVQLTFVRSIDRIFTTEHTISRQAFTGDKNIKSGTGTLGKKHTVAYGLYRSHGFINPVFAEKTGFSETDLAVIWKALAELFDLDRSAARGLMAVRGVHIFKHDSKLGSAPAHRLFETVSVQMKEGVVFPRSFQDYIVRLPQQSALPPGITLIDGSSLGEIGRAHV